MIVKNNHDNALVYVNGEEKMKSDIKKGIIIAIPRRYHQLYWKINWEELKNKTLIYSKPINIDARKMVNGKFVLCLNNFNNCTVSVIPSRLRQPKVFIVNNMDNFNELMYFYCRKLNK